MSDKPTFTVNMGLVHLVIEQAAAFAARGEVERQFREQHPRLQLSLSDCTVDFPSFDRLNLDVPGWDVRFVRP